MLNKVVENLNLPMGVKALSQNVTVKPVDDTSILSVAVKDQNAEQSTVIANEIAKVFTKEIKKIYK